MALMHRCLLLLGALLPTHGFVKPSRDNTVGESLHEAAERKLEKAKDTIHGYDFSKEVDSAKKDVVKVRDAIPDEDSIKWHATEIKQEFQHVPSELAKLTDAVRDIIPDLNGPGIHVPGWEDVKERMEGVKKGIKEHMPDVTEIKDRVEKVKDAVRSSNVVADFTKKVQSAKRSALEKLGNEMNFCSEQKLLPKFYMLGAPKCASTSLSEDMLRGAHEGAYAFYPAPKVGSIKEWHFWHKFKATDNFTKNRALWIKELADCPSEPAMLGDFNVNNLAAVPLPKTMKDEALGYCTCDKEYMKKGLTDQQHDVPSNLKEAYGDSIDAVSFVVMIREPLSRMQSAWYHARYEDFLSYWGFADCCTESFNEAMKQIVEGGSDVDSSHPMFMNRLGGEGSVWTSMYARHLEAYMKHFSPAQFIVIPYKQYFAGSKVEICNEISERLGHKVCKDGEPLHDEHLHPHPKLEEDLDPRLHAIFKKMMKPENDRLVDILTDMHTKGAKLAGYKGAPGARAKVKEWLEESW